jgi:hypothetical protein
MELRLPQLTVGGAWVGQNTDPGVPTPVVDEVKGLVGGVATIFQRMNADGDMIRVATNVETEDGLRAHLAEELSAAVADSGLHIGLEDAAPPWTAGRPNPRHRRSRTTRSTSVTHSCGREERAPRTRQEDDVRASAIPTAHALISSQFR